MTSAAVRFMRLASSPTEISSGMDTLTGIFLSAAICCWRCRRRIFSCSSCRRLLPKGRLRWSAFLVSFCLVEVPILFAFSGTSLSMRSSYLARLTSPPPRVSMRCTCLTLLCCGCAGLAAAGCPSAGLADGAVDSAGFAGAAGAGFASGCAGLLAASCAFSVPSMSST
ncbi:MAG: hypothetical protein MEEGG_02921 [Eggerthella lenta]